jgi:tetratricopeptide (TPR) repeat protein
MVQRVRGAWWVVPVAAAALVVGCAAPEERAAGYASKAVELLAEGDREKAKIEARNALQLAPKNVPARYVLAQIAEADGEIGQMLGHLEVVIAEDPTHVPSRLTLAKLLIFSQDYAGAQILLDQLAKLAPNDPAYRLLLARQKFQQNDIPGGIAILDQVIADQPQNAEAALLRGVAISLQDARRGLAELDAAIPRLDKDAAQPLRQARIDILARLDDQAGVERELRALVADFPGSAYARDLASYLAAQGRLDEAEQALRQAVAADPANFDLKFALAQFISRSRNQPAAAEATLKEFIAASPDEPRLSVLLGTFYEASGRPAEALVQYQVVADKDPRSDTGYEARARIAALQLAAGQPAEARAAYDRILEDAPDNVGALQGRGELNLAERRYDDAIADLRGVLRKEPERPAALLGLARAHVGRGDSTLAQDAYRRLLEANPAEVEGRTELGVLLQSAGRLDEAGALFREAQKLQPNYVPAASGVVEVLIAQGDLKAAEAEARKLVALDDARGIGQIQLGKVLQGQGEHPGAIAAYRAALAKDPASILALRGLAGSLTLTNQLEAAGREIEKFLKNNDSGAGKVDAEVLLSGNLIRRQQLDAARAAAERALALNPADSRAYILLASTYPQDPAARERVLLRGIEAEPRASDLWRLLAGDYQQAGRTDDAIALYERGVKAAPRDLALANNLASLLLDTRTDEASLNRALELARPFADSRSAAGLDTLGWAHYRLKDYPQAVQYLERALALESANPIIRYHLGMAYKFANNPVGATQQLEQALATGGDRFPGAREARAALDELRRTATPG